MTRPRVLIADPDPDRLTAYRDYLVSDGFEVATAGSALECLERLREFAPDLLVLAPFLPWGGGDGVLARVSEDPRLPRVPVIVLSSVEDLADAPRLWDFPITEFHSQPVSPPLLARRIRLHLANRGSVNSPGGQ
ncbi:MAG TPA: response regulator [Gemmataceae bacterium]|nr:response regulator [Gemmataceae bacterium]